MGKTTIIFLSIIVVCVLVAVVLVLVVKCQHKKYKELKEHCMEIESENENLNEEKNQLKEGLEIERKKKMELAKKLAGISCMSIDDVMHQLQDNDSN